MALLVALVATTVLVHLTALPAGASAPPFALDVPYVTQLDNSPYAGANCGPASMVMAFRAFGQTVSVDEVRKQVNRIQGTTGYNTGTALDTIETIVKRQGLTPVGYKTNGKINRWNVDSLTRELEAGNPVIPLVVYPALPGNENSSYRGGHYIVLTGIDGDDFIYHEPASRNGTGVEKRISSARLMKAMNNASFPYAAIAIAPGPDGTQIAKRHLGETIMVSQPVVEPLPIMVSQPVIDPLPPHLDTPFPEEASLESTLYVLRDQITRTNQLAANPGAIW
jgi:hypothetical protein